MPKYYHVVCVHVEGPCDTLHVLFRYLESLVRALPKCVPDCVGSHALLLSKTRINGLLKGVVEFCRSELRLSGDWR